MQNNLFQPLILNWQVTIVLKANTKNKYPLLTLLSNSDYIPQGSSSAPRSVTCLTTCNSAQWFHHCLLKKMNIDFPLVNLTKQWKDYMSFGNILKTLKFIMFHTSGFFFLTSKPLALVEIVSKSFIFYFLTPRLLPLKTAMCIFPYMLNISVHLANSWNYNVDFIVRWHSTVGKTTIQNTQMNSNQFKPGNAGEGGKAEEGTQRFTSRNITKQKWSKPRSYDIASQHTLPLSLPSPSPQWFI